MATKRVNKAAKASPVAVASINAHRFWMMLHNAALFMVNDETLPMLHGVRIDADNHRIAAVATDRYTLGVSWIDYDNSIHTGTAGEDVAHGFMIGRDDVATILKIAKTTKRDMAHRIVYVTANPDSTVEFKFSTGETITARHHDHQFPKWKQLLPSGDPVARTAFGFTNQYLAKFGRVVCDVPNDRIAIFSFDAGHSKDPVMKGDKIAVDAQKKPYGVRIGESFLGLIMPVRLEASCDWARPAWLDS